MRVAVTGATGNIGTRLLQHLHDDPAVTSVVGLARRPPELQPDSPDWLRAVDWKRVDLAAPGAQADITAAFLGCQAVVHLAWLLQPSRDEAVMRATNVDGTRRVLSGVVAAGVPALVHSSSVGAYGPGPKHPPVDETWPATGIASSAYSRHKAIIEADLDRLEADRDGLRVVRIRPGIVLQRRAGSEQGRYFLGPLVPFGLVRPRFIPVVPDIPRLTFQVVHADDVAELFHRAVTSDVRGAFNAATEPVIDPAAIGRVLGARPVPVPAAVARAVVEATWRARLQPTDPGWLDLARMTPLMDVGRADRELGWRAERGADDVLREAILGVRDSAGGPTPVLRAS